MAQTPYRRGWRFEAKVRRKLRECGYFVIRSAGSKTPFDLVAIPASPDATSNIQKSFTVYVGERALSPDETSEALLDKILLIQCGIRKPKRAVRELEAVKLPHPACLKVLCQPARRRYITMQLLK
jgi:hypothetical protein